MRLISAVPEHHAGVNCGPRASGSLEPGRRRPRVCPQAVADGPSQPFIRARFHPPRTRPGQRREFRSTWTTVASSRRVGGHQRDCPPGTCRWNHRPCSMDERISAPAVVVPDACSRRHSMIVPNLEERAELHLGPQRSNLTRCCRICVPTPGGGGGAAVGVCELDLQDLAADDLAVHLLDRRLGLVNLQAGGRPPGGVGADVADHTARFTAPPSKTPLSVSSSTSSERFLT